MGSGVAVHRSNHREDRTGPGPDGPWRWRVGAADANRSALILGALIAALSGAWLVLVFLVEPMRFAIFDPQAKTGFEVFLAIGQIFGAFVLAISPIRPAFGRLRYVSAGFFVFGVGAIGYGYVYPSLVGAPSPVVTMYGSLYVRIVGTVLCAIGLAAPRVPTISPAALSRLAAGIALIGILLVPLADDLPALFRIPGDANLGAGHGPLRVSDLEAIISSSAAVFPGLTAWHFGLTMIPLAASSVAAWSAARRASAAGGIGLWLVLALALLASAQLHSVFWPSMYSSVLSTTSILRLAVALAVVVGGILELRTVIHQRDELLLAEQERSQRLEDLARLKADFTAIVAHELVNPIAAIKTMAQVVALDDLLLAEQERSQRLEDLARLKADFTAIVAHELVNPIAAIKAMAQVVALDDVPADMRRRTADEIEGEARLLEMLVEDIQETSNVERADFRVAPQRISVDRLVAEAAAYARSLPGAHPVSVEHAATTSVRGDPDRLGQVIRNLLNNAVRYTPEGTPIVIRTQRDHDGVVIEVTDRGPGIAPEDIDRIFEKFGRGRDAAQRYASGRGLGLYLSRRIMRSHHSDLVVESTPGQGTSFRFRLKELP